MRIEKFTKLNVASFDNHTWNNELPDFADVNIILGWNGTGKTVLSRILRSYEHGEITNIPIDSQFTLKTNGAALTQQSIKGQEDKIRVFNEDYIKFITSQSNLPHVIYIGETAVDYSGKEAELAALKSLGRSCVDEHTRIAQDRAEVIRTISGIATLNKELQTGLYNAYDKRSFDKRIQTIMNQLADGGSQLTEFILEEEKLAALTNKLAQKANRDREISSLTSIQEWLAQNTRSIEILLSRDITHTPSDRISKYNKDSSEYQWIRTGVKIHKLNETENQLNKCLFCSSPIHNKDELIRHFTQDILELTSGIEDAIIQLTSKISTLSQVGFSFFDSEKSELLSYLSEVKMKLEEKKNDPTLFPSISEYEAVNFEASEEDFDAIAHQIESHYVASVYESYSEKKKANTECKIEQDELKLQIKAVEAELSALKAQAQNVHIPAERISNMLKVTFPYKEIELRNSEAGVGYELFRNGEEFNIENLSEGERNFMALAYFLLSLNSEAEGEAFSEDGIVVIDDPVSSLDKNSVFQIFSIISYEMEQQKNRQYFLLTHNLEFLSHLLDHYQKRISDGEIQLYQVSLDNSGSQLIMLNDLLKKFNSDYQYSIKVLWDHKDECSLADSFLMVNLLRRVWETFLYFKFSSSNDLRSMLDKAYNESCEMRLKSMGEKVPEARKNTIAEEYRSNCLSMYRFINYGSHQFGSIDTIDESILLKASEKITDFFNVVRVIDKHHFSRITGQS